MLPVCLFRTEVTHSPSREVIRQDFGRFLLDYLKEDASL